MSQGMCTELVVEDESGPGHSRHGCVTFAQFQQQLARLCQELNSFSELSAAERDIVASPRAEQPGVEQLLGAVGPTDWRLAIAAVPRDAAVP